MKFKAGLDSNPGSVTNDLWDIGKTFLYGIVETECESWCSYILIVRETAGTQGKYLAPKARLPGFVS